MVSFALFCAFENKMLNKMRHAAFLLIFIARTGIDHQSAMCHSTLLFFVNDLDTVF